MANRILDMVVLNHRLDPHESEVHVHVRLESIAATTAIKGRLTGPRCAHASTIEIAYPLREIERSEQIVLRAVIPEPSWWEPETPFLYDVALELTEDGQSCDRVRFQHGIRTLQLTQKGLRLNGKPFNLRGKIVEPTWSEADARALRQAGFNAVWIPSPPTPLPEGEGSNARDIADRIGFFVLGSSADIGGFVERRYELTAHASHFAWIFNREQFTAAPPQTEGCPMFYGINTSAASRPENADFLVCHERELAWLDGVDVPKIVIVDRLPEKLPAWADVIGWIESPTA